VCILVLLFSQTNFYSLSFEFSFSFMKITLTHTICRRPARSFNSPRLRPKSLKLVMSSCWFCALRILSRSSSTCTKRVKIFNFQQPLTQTTKSVVCCFDHPFCNRSMLCCFDHPFCNRSMLTLRQHTTHISLMMASSVNSDCL